MKIFSFLQSLDYMGNSINFTINSNDTFKTIFGGLVSFLMYILTAYLFITFGQNYIYKLNPSGYSQIVPSSSKNIKPLNLTENEFVMGFQVYDMNWKVINLTDYYHTIFYLRKVTFDRKKNEFVNSRTKINPVPCSELKLHESVHKGHIDLKGFMCPDFRPYKDQKPNIHGNFDSDEFSIIEFFVRPCDEKSANCKNLTRMQELEKGPKLWISTAVPIAKYNIDEKKSLHTELHNSYGLLSVSSYTYAEFEFSRFQSDTDTGNLFPAISSESAIGMSEFFITNAPPNERIFDIDYLTKDPNADINFNNVFKINVMFSNNKFYYSRWYLKLPDVVANVGGIVDLAIFIVTFFYSYYSKFSFDNYICKELLFIEEETQNEKRNLREIFLAKSIKNKAAFNNSRNNLNNFNNLKDLNKFEGNIPQPENFKENNNLENSERNKILNNNNNNGNENSNNSNNNKSINNIDQDKSADFKEIPLHNISEFQNKSNIQLQELDSSNINNKENNLNQSNLNPNDNSINNFNNNNKNSNNSSEKEFFKSNWSIFNGKMESIINKYFVSNNEFDFRYDQYLRNILCPTLDQKTKKKFETFDEYPDKFYKKLDIFHYLKLINKIKIWQKILFSVSESQIMKPMYKKNYKINLLEENKQESLIVTNAGKTVKILDILNAYGENGIKGEEEKIIDYLLS